MNKMILLNEPIKNLSVECPQARKKQNHQFLHLQKLKYKSKIHFSFHSKIEQHFATILLK
jgi:hypothetical protein